MPLWTTQAIFLGLPKFIFPEVKRSRNGADRSTVCSAEIKNGWRYTSIPPHIFKACLEIYTLKIMEGDPIALQCPFYLVPGQGRCIMQKTYSRCDITWQIPSSETKQDMLHHWLRYYFHFNLAFTVSLGPKLIYSCPGGDTVQGLNKHCCNYVQWLRSVNWLLFLIGKLWRSATTGRNMLPAKITQILAVPLARWTCWQP